MLPFHCSRRQRERRLTIPIYGWGWGMPLSSMGADNCHLPRNLRSNARQRFRRTIPGRPFSSGLGSHRQASSMKQARSGADCLPVHPPMRHGRQTWKRALHRSASFQQRPTIRLPLQKIPWRNETCAALPGIMSYARARHLLQRPVGLGSFHIEFPRDF